MLLKELLDILWNTLYGRFSVLIISDYDHVIPTDLRHIIKFKYSVIDMLSQK